MNTAFDPARYDAMPYRRCGRSGLLLPAVALGLWNNFGADDPPEERRRLLRLAFDLGVTHFDLANNYGPPPGAAETLFGEALRRDFAGRRDELIVSTKAGYRMWPGPYGDYGSRKYLLAGLDASLRRLGLDYVDVFYHHRPDPETPLEETAGALAHAVRSGKALYVGVSNYGPDETQRMAALLAAEGAPLLVHQPKYNLLHRDPERGLLGVLERLGVGCVVFSPLAQGLLTGKYTQGAPSDSRAARPDGTLGPEALSEARRRAVAALGGVAAAEGLTTAQLALCWALRDRRITSAVIGARTEAQLRENVEAAAAPPLAPETLAAMEQAVAGL